MSAGAAEVSTSVVSEVTQVTATAFVPNSFRRGSCGGEEMSPGPPTEYAQVSAPPASTQAPDTAPTPTLSPYATHSPALAREPTLQSQLLHFLQLERRQMLIQ